MKHGKLIADLLCQARGGGIPWFSILSPARLAMVAHATGPGGNVGFPVQDEEIAHFALCLNKARKHMSDADVDHIVEALRENAREILGAREKARKQREARKKETKRSRG